MTSTVKASTLKVTIKEDIYLNGKNHGSHSTLQIPSVNETYNRIVTVTTTEAQVLTFHATAIGAGTFIAGDVRYMRFTNLDDTNYIMLTFANEDADEFTVKLDYGQSFIYNGTRSGGVVDSMDAIAASGLPYAFGDLSLVLADANSASCDMEIFVASA